MYPIISIMKQKLPEPIKYIFIILLILPVGSVNAQQKVITLYNGPVPGSENWNRDEKKFFVKNPLNATVAYNVSNPTLTIFTPDTANGVSVIICPGGGFHMLNIETEGNRVARELIRKGITVFLLRYRVVHSLSDDPWQEMMNSMRDSAVHQQKIAQIKILAQRDLNIALHYVRENAVNYKIHPNKVGLLGFSAGGTLVLNQSIEDIKEARPDFAALIYTVYKPGDKSVIPVNAPRVFIASATDDKMAPPINSINLYTRWIVGNNSAELHIYEKGGHGLQVYPAFSWIQRFVEWIEK